MFDVLAQVVNLLLTHGFQAFLIIVLVAQWYFIQKWVREALNGDRVKKDRLEEVESKAQAEILRNTENYDKTMAVKDGQITMLTGLLQDVKTSRDELAKSLANLAEKTQEENFHYKASIKSEVQRLENGNSSAESG